MGRSSLQSISWLHHQMFYPKVTISATQAHESDDLRHEMSPFSLFLSSFSGVQRILGYVRPRRIVAVHPPQRGKRRSIWRSLQIGTTVTRRSDVIALYMLLWQMQTLNWDTAADICSNFHGSPPKSLTVAPQEKSVGRSVSWLTCSTFNG